MADYPRRSTLHGSLGEERRRNRTKGIRQEDIQGASGGMSLLKATGVYDSDLIAFSNYSIDGVAGTINDSPYQPAIPAGDWILHFVWRFDPGAAGSAIITPLRNESGIVAWGGDFNIDLSAGEQDTTSFALPFVGGADLMISINYFGSADPDGTRLGLMGWGS